VSSPSEPNSNLVHFSLNVCYLVVTILNNYFAENLPTIFSARDAGDFSDSAGEREMAPKCESLPRDAGDLVGLEPIPKTQTVPNMRNVLKNLRL